MGTKNINFAGKHFDMGVKLNFGLGFPKSVKNLDILAPKFLNDNIAIYVELSKAFFGQRNFDAQYNQNVISKEEIVKIESLLISQIESVLKVQGYNLSEKFLFNSMGTLLLVSSGSFNAEYKFNPQIDLKKFTTPFSVVTIAQELRKRDEKETLVYSIGDFIRRINLKNPNDIIAIMAIQKINNEIERIKSYTDIPEESFTENVTLEAFILYCEYMNSILSSNKNRANIASWEYLYKNMVEVNMIKKVASGLLTEEVWQLDFENLTAIYNQLTGGDEVLENTGDILEPDFLLSEIFNNETYRKVLVERNQEWNELMQNYGYLTGYPDIDITVEGQTIPAKDIAIITLQPPMLHITLTGYNYVNSVYKIENYLNKHLDVTIRFSYIDSNYNGVL